MRALVLGCCVTCKGTGPQLDVIWGHGASGNAVVDGARNSHEPICASRTTPRTPAALKFARTTAERSPARQFLYDLPEPAPVSLRSHLPATEPRVWHKLSAPEHKSYIAEAVLRAVGPVGHSRMAVHSGTTHRTTSGAQMSRAPLPNLVPSHELRPEFLARARPSHRTLPPTLAPSSCSAPPSQLEQERDHDERRACEQIYHEVPSEGDVDVGRHTSQHPQRSSMLSLALKSKLVPGMRTVRFTPCGP